MIGRLIGRKTYKRKMEKIIGNKEKKPEKLKFRNNRKIVITEVAGKKRTNIGKKKEK